MNAQGRGYEGSQADERTPGGHTGFEGATPRHQVVPYRSSGSTLTRNKPWYISPFLFQACPTRSPVDAIRMHSVLNTFFSKPLSVRGEKETHTAAQFWFMSFFFLFFLSFFFTQTVYLFVPRQRARGISNLQTYFKSQKGG